MTGMPTPGVDPSELSSLTWTGVFGFAVFDGAALVVGALAVTVVVVPLALVVTGSAPCLLLPELQADRASAAPASSASALHIRRGRGVELGFVTPSR